MESVREIQPSSRKGKKYMAILCDGTKIHFGASEYQQYKDSTKLKLYSHKDHNDNARRRNYFSRHSAGITNKRDAIAYELRKSGRVTAKILSHKYLW